MLMLLQCLLAVLFVNSFVFPLCIIKPYLPASFWRCANILVTYACDEASNSMSSASLKSMSCRPCSFTEIPNVQAMSPRICTAPLGCQTS
eukprot:251484-Karenia_brevis.AAC.1